MVSEGNFHRGRTVFLWAFVPGGNIQGGNYPWGGGGVNVPLVFGRGVFSSEKRY